MASLILFAVLSVGCTGAVPNPVFRVFYLNLNKSQDRRTHMDKLLSDFPGAVERVPAISGEQVDLPPFDAYIERQGVDPDLIFTAAHEKRSLPNTIACWLSHVRLWERLQTELKRNEVALILEDDVWLPSNLTEALLDTVHSAPSHWDVLKVCGWGTYRAADLVNDKWAVTTQPVFERTTAGDIVDGPFYGGSCGYLVHAMSLPRVLKHVLSQKIKDIDVAMLVHQSLNNLRGSERKLGSDFAVFEQLPDKKIISPGGFASTIGSNSSSAPPTPTPTPAPTPSSPSTPSPPSTNTLTLTAYTKRDCEGVWTPFQYAMADMSACVSFVRPSGAFQKLTCEGTSATLRLFYDSSCASTAAGTPVIFTAADYEKLRNGQCANAATGHSYTASGLSFPTCDTVDPQEQELTNAAFGVAMSRTALTAIALAIFV